MPDGGMPEREKNMKIAGLDIGTTSCKLTVFDENGKMLGKASRDYPVRRHVSGHKIDVSGIMDGVWTRLNDRIKWHA